MDNNKSYVFTGKGDFSDFNNKVRDSSSTMSSSFKKAYDDMLKSSYDYSQSTKKQFQLFSELFSKFKQEKLASFEVGKSQELEKFELELENKLRDLEKRRKQLLDTKSLKSDFADAVNSNTSGGQSLEGFTSLRKKKINSEIDSEREKLVKEFEKLVTKVEGKSSKEIDDLRGKSPESVFSQFRDLARQQILEAKQQNKSLYQVIKDLEDSEDIENKILASQLREELAEENRVTRRNRTEEERELERKNSKGGQEDILGSLLNAGYLQKIVGAASALPRAKDGTELFSSLIDIGASTGGMVSQSLTSMLPGMGKVIAPFVGTLVEGGLQIAGEAVKRTMEERNSLERAIFSLPLYKGRDLGFQDLSSVGVSFTDYVNEQGQVIKRQGNASNKTNQNVETAIYLDKAALADKSTSYELLEIQRNTNKSLQSTLGMIIEKGDKRYFSGGSDYSFMNEFTTKFISLQKELLKGSTRVSDTATFDILANFNKLGGQFSTNDSRSLGNILSISNSLSNPQNDGERALMYALISKRNPNMDLFDIEQESQKGIGNFGYFKDKLRFLKETYGGDPESLKFAISSGFGLDNNKSAAREIYNNMDLLLNSNISEQEFKSKFTNKDFKSTAESVTTQLEKNAAQLTNEFTKGALEGLKAAGGALVEVVKQSFAGAEIKMDGGSLKFRRGPVVIENTTKKPTSYTPNVNRGDSDYNGYY